MISETDQKILLVEDNDDDAELTARAFKQARVGNAIVRVGDGVEALEYLFCTGPYVGRNIADAPALVLLDLKLPRMNGLEVLAAVRADSRTSHLPIVVLTSSVEDRDLLAAYEKHANSYVQKPVNYDQFVIAARELGLYWMVLNRPPPRKP